MQRCMLAGKGFPGQQKMEMVSQAVIKPRRKGLKVGFTIWASLSPDRWLKGSNLWLQQPQP
jgi:hypothetical protein